MALCGEGPKGTHSLIFIYSPSPLFTYLSSLIRQINSSRIYFPPPVPLLSPPLIFVAFFHQCTYQFFSSVGFNGFLCAVSSHSDPSSDKYSFSTPSYWQWTHQWIWVTLLAGWQFPSIHPLLTLLILWGSQGVLEPIPAEHRTYRDKQLFAFTALGNLQSPVVDTQTQVEHPISRQKGLVCQSVCQSISVQSCSVLHTLCHGSSSL